MRTKEELFGSLSELVDLHEHRLTLHGVPDGLKVDLTLVSEGMEHCHIVSHNNNDNLYEQLTIVGLDGLESALLVAKNQVNPLVQMRAHMLTLQRLPVLPDKILHI